MSSAQVLPTDSLERFEYAVGEAVRLLRAGKVVALPTETVYGLAANALNAQAVESIFHVKGRPRRNPLIVHVADLDMARQCVADWPALAAKAAHAFWPGPLTLVLPRAEVIPDIVTAGGPTVGVRWPSHPLMLAVIRACGFPLAAPSANLSNRVSPTNAAHVREQLGEHVPLIIDGGQSQVGIESTVLDLTTSPPRVLRPGMIHEPALVAAIGAVEVSAGTHSGVLRSPGLLRKHYAPRASLVLWSWRDEAELRRRVAQFSSSLPAGEGLGVRAPHSEVQRVHVIAHTHIPSGQGFARVSVIPHDAVAFARAIYAELHACDQAGAELIIVEALPPGGEWQAIADRLHRAAA
ncbi:MAG: L-threonylcarbamoyladenylate synthase [Limisphaerales bacterium]